MVTVETLPIYIINISNTLLDTVSEGVIPNEYPQVARADITSNKISIKAICGFQVTKRMLANEIINKANIPTVTAFFIVSSFTSLLKTITVLFSEMELTTVKARMAKVTVFIPPAVLPGAPPISIKMAVKNFPPFGHIHQINSRHTRCSGRNSLKKC